MTSFYQQGWHYLSDDVIPLDLTTGKILPFPQTPRVRQHTGVLVPSDRLAEVPKFEVMLESNRVCQEAVSVKAIVFMHYNPEIEVAASSCSSGTIAIELLRNCINFADHKQTAIQQVSELVKRALGVQLTFSDTRAALFSLQDQFDVLTTFPLRQM